MTTFANPIDLQNRLFFELSKMFGEEVPLYDKSLLVNRECNRAVCDLLGRRHIGFSIDDEQLGRTSGERHGAIRVGTPTEYRWIARLFAVFAMEPHAFFNMTDVGTRSQPVIATAFRSVVDPEHRVFTSLLMTDWFDDDTQHRIEALLADRRVFSDRAKALVERFERDGGLREEDGVALIAECTGRIFKWTGTASDHALYRHLCDAGFKIAADVACFHSHHLNHLTPNTFCIDLYTAAMRFRLGEIDDAAFTRRATTVLGRLPEVADRDWMRLHFRHLTADSIEEFAAGRVDAGWIADRAATLTARLRREDLDLGGMNHAGFKDFTEGPAHDTPVLLRQDAYKALSEAVRFTERDGSTVDTLHTARFGEIEQRFYATTRKGRELYDACLAQAERERAADPSLLRRDFEAYEARYAEAFAAFPKSLSELLRAGLVFGRYRTTRTGRAAAGSPSTTDLNDLVAEGFVAVEGIRYEDFLPVSAAGIFASNLNQYGTKSTATSQPTYTQARLEEVIGRPIVDTTLVYAAAEAESILRVYEDLGVLGRVDPRELERLERVIADAGTALGRSAIGAASS